MASRKPGNLVSYWWDSFDGPYYIAHQLFGEVVSESDLGQRVYANGFSVRPRTQAWITNSGKSEVVNDVQKFEVSLDVSHFGKRELFVGVYTNSVVVSARHEEKSDDYGFITRSFERRYALPKECVKEEVTVTLTPNGVLVILAPKVYRLEDRESALLPYINDQTIDEKFIDVNEYGSSLVDTSVIEDEISRSLRARIAAQNARGIESSRKSVSE